MDIQTNPAASMTAPFAERYDNFIGGKWVAPKDGRCFDNISPMCQPNLNFIGAK